MKFTATHTARTYPTHNPANNTKIVVTAEIATYLASLGDNETWQKLLDGDEIDYTIIKKPEDQVINLAMMV